MGEQEKLERCCYCDEPTGKAGRGDDSNYLDSVGPYCDEHYEEIRDDVYTDVLGSYHGTTPEQVAELRADRERLGWYDKRARDADAVDGLIIIYNDGDSEPIGEAPTLRAAIDDARAQEGES